MTQPEPATPKPETFNGNVSMLPPALEDLREQKVWVCWNWFLTKKGKWTKPPYRTDNPQFKAATDDPASWGTYEQAVKQVLSGNADGLGFTLQGRNIGAIDLDDCVDPGGAISPWANAYVQQFPGAYVERTVSGTGLRIVGRSELNDFAPKFKFPDEGIAVELFSNSTHYLTLSCNALGECDELPPIGAQLESIAAELGERRDKSNGSGFDFNARPYFNAKPATETPEPEARPAEESTSSEQPQPNPWSFAAELRLRSALGCIPTDEAQLSAKLGHSHGSWVRIGRAIERLGWGQHGFAIFRDWSSQNQKEFDEEGLLAQWKSFRRHRDDRADPVTVGTVFHYAKKFGWGDAPKQERARANNNSNEDNEIFDAVELDKMEFDPVKSVVPGVFVEGLTLFCGKPKLGKSWLLLHACHAVSCGGFTLGNTHCIAGDVLCCSLEDNKRRLKSRMRKLFHNQPRSPRLRFLTAMPRLAEGGLDVLRKWIKSVPHPRMIAIDTLAMVRMPNRKDQSTYDADYAAVVELRNLAHEFGIAIVLVHHVRKMEADDPFDTISGTLGLTGCPDSIVILKRDTTGTMLLGRGRDLEEIEKAITFNKQTCSWTIEGDANEVRRSAQQQAILAALREADEPRTPQQIASDVGMKVTNVKHMLGRMVADGSLQKAGRGKYQLVPTKQDEDFG